MGVLREGSMWCFCSGGGRSERVKGGIFCSNGPALAAISTAGGGTGGGVVTGFLIHRNLLLTTHANLPSAAAAETTEIRLCHGRLSARLLPQRFFITSPILDLTIVGLDVLDGDSTSEVQQPHYLKTTCNPCLALGNTVYLLGHTDKMELTVGEGKLVIATDNLVKLCTDGVTWCPGSAGFDSEGNLAFMVCDPMKLASSPTGRSCMSSSSSPSWKKDASLQFGIPIPVICGWLHQHWKGSLDEVSKPKLSLIRLMSTGQRSDNACASFTLRNVFKAFEDANDDELPSSPIHRRSRYPLGPSCSANSNAMFSHDKNLEIDLECAHEQGIPTPDIFESPKLSPGPVQKKEYAPVQLLDINFPPKTSRSIFLPLPLKNLLPDENSVQELKPGDMTREVGSSSRDVPEIRCETKYEHSVQELKPGDMTREVGSSSRDVPEIRCEAKYELPPVGTWQGHHRIEVHGSSSPTEASELQNEVNVFTSEEETMYSAETMESRNIPIAKEAKLHQVRRSQSCVNCSRTCSSQRNSTPRKAALQKQHSSTPARKTHSQSSALPQRSHDYYSPTVSSSMKKWNGAENSRRPRQTLVQMSPRWMF